MAVAQQRLTVEISAAPGKEALVAYADGVLDHAARLAVSRTSGKLSAEVFLDGRRVVIRCGQVSLEQVARLEGLQTILWTRMEGENTIAVAEVSLQLV